MAKQIVCQSFGDVKGPTQIRRGSMWLDKSIKGEQIIWYVASMFDHEDKKSCKTSKISAQIDTLDIAHLEQFIAEW